MSVTFTAVGVSVTSFVVRVAVCATAVVEDPDPDDVDDEAHDGHRLNKKRCRVMKLIMSLNVRNRRQMIEIKCQIKTSVSTGVFKKESYFT